jgi:hypothetical protein
VAQVKKMVVGGPGSMRAAMRARGWESAPGAEIRQYAGAVHRSNQEVNDLLRPLIEDPADRRYFLLPAGVDHPIPEWAFRVIADNGRYLADQCAGPDGLLAEFRDL